jgi:hypothetical protein
VVLLLWTVRDFYVAGRGICAVVVAAGARCDRAVSLFRNPMYIAVVMVLVGWALAFHSSLLGIYVCDRHRLSSAVVWRGTVACKKHGEKQRYETSATLAGLSQPAD